MVEVRYIKHVWDRDRKPVVDVDHGGFWLGITTRSPVWAVQEALLYHHCHFRVNHRSTPLTIPILNISLTTTRAMSPSTFLSLLRLPIFQPLRRYLRIPRPHYQIWSDASGQGYGAHLGPTCRPIAIFQAKRLLRISLPPPSQFHSIPLGKDIIEIHEATALWLCINRWRHFLRGSVIDAYMDNSTVCDYASGAIARRGYGNGTKAIVESIKQLAMQEDIQLRITWRPREENKLADGLSKFVGVHPSYNSRVLKLLRKEWRRRLWGIRIPGAIEADVLEVLLQDYTGTRLKGRTRAAWASLTRARRQVTVSPWTWG